MPWPEKTYEPTELEYFKTFAVNREPLAPRACDQRTNGNCWVLDGPPAYVRGVIPTCRGCGGPVRPTGDRE